VDAIKSLSRAQSDQEVWIVALESIEQSLVRSQDLALLVEDHHIPVNSFQNYFDDRVFQRTEHLRRKFPVPESLRAGKVRLLFPLIHWI
jgi:hypothetical protein